MTKLTITRQITVVVATFLVSSTCLVAAIGPATGNNGGTATVAARQLA